MPRLLEAFRTHLVDQGIVRAPSVAGPLPPLWLQPRRGVPGPGELPENGTTVQMGADVVAGASLSGGFTIARFESFQRTPTVEVRIRARKAPFAEDLETLITRAVIDKTNWNMGGLTVLESQMWRALTPVESDSQSFDYLVAYWFEIPAP